MKWLRYVLFVLVAGALGAWYWVRSTQPTEVEVVRAEKTSITLAFNSEAYVVGKTYDLSPEVAGRITAIKVREGQRVSLGELILQVDSTEVNAAIAAAQSTRETATLAVAEAVSAYQSSSAQVTNARERAMAVLRQSEANLRRTMRGPRQEQVAKARHELERVQAAEAEMERRYVRAEKLFQAGVLPLAQRDAAKTEWETTSSQVETSFDILKELENGPLPEEIDAARAAVSVAKADLHQASDLALDLHTRRAQIQSARSRVQQADMEIRRLRELLPKYSLRSPVGGVVVRRLAEVGMMGSPSLVALRISTREDLHVEAEIRSEDLSIVKVGMPVDITLPSSSQSVPGKVERLASAAEPKPDAAIRTRIVRARIRPLLSDERFVPGLEVDVRGEQTQPSTLTVPSDAILIENGETVVWVLDGSKAHRMKVIIGKAAGDRTEILQGLKSGEMVIVAGKQSLVEGQIVGVVK